MVNHIYGDLVQIEVRLPLFSQPMKDGGDVVKGDHYWARHEWFPFCLVKLFKGHGEGGYDRTFLLRESPQGDGFLLLHFELENKH